MINFLPPEEKEYIIYGRKNKVLLSWISAFTGVLLAVLLLTVGGSFYIKNEANIYVQKAEEASSRIKNEKLEVAQKDAEAFSANLDTVMQIFKDQLLFSKIIKSIGAVLPNGVTLKEINYDSKESTMSLDIIAPTEYDATQAYINISSKENKLFTKADLVQVQRTDDEGFTANIVAQINKDSEFFFLNDVSQKAKEQN